MELNDRIYFVSLGCPKNLVDTEIMLGMLLQEGCQTTQRVEEAEVIIVNTCSFIEAAKEESIDTILELAEFKKKGRCRLLIVTGCLPQRYKDTLVNELPEVDFFLGTGEFQKVADLLNRDEKSFSQVKMRIDEPLFLYDEKTPRLNTLGVNSAYVKIAEGCSNSCSYCIIGKLRGKFRSRSPHSIVSEVQNLARMGMKEINLIGQDTTLYGRDLCPHTNIEELLRSLATIDGIEWIRTLYCHPAHFSNGLIQFIKEEEKICNYVDLPIQHINNRILTAMKRKTTGRNIRKLIERLRKEIPGVCIRTSLIVGFPGETDEQFNELLSFIKEVEFDRLGAFLYSREEGTLAATFPNQISETIKQERHSQIMETQKGIALINNKRLVGSITKVLIEGACEETPGYLKGRTPLQAPDIDGITYLVNGGAEAVGLSNMTVIDCNEYDLIGKII